MTNEHQLRPPRWAWTRLALALMLSGAGSCSWSAGSAGALCHLSWIGVLAINPPCHLAETTKQPQKRLKWPYRKYLLYFRVSQARSNDKSTIHIKSFFMKSVTYATLIVIFKSLKTWMSHFQVSQDLDESFQVSQDLDESFSSLSRLGWVMMRADFFL